MRQLPEILQELVPTKGKNQSDVARKLGISSQLLGHYVRGRRKPGGKFFLQWRKTFGEDLLAMIETKVSRENDEKNAGEKDRVSVDNDMLMKLLQEKEARLEEARAFAHKMEQHYNDMKNIVVQNLNIIITNLGQNQASLEILKSQSDIVIKQIARWDAAAIESQTAGPASRPGKVKHVKDIHE